MSDIRKDPRFSKALYDPQFHTMKKSNRKKSSDKTVESKKTNNNLKTKSDTKILKKKVKYESEEDSSDYSESDFEEYDVVSIKNEGQNKEDEIIQAQNIRLGIIKNKFKKK